MKKILLVEDDQILLKMYSEKFQRNGYEIIVAADGEQALEQVDLLKPDFIILDLMLPKLNGNLVLKKLKENPQTRDIPVAILSVMPEEDEFKQLIESKDVYAYWRKDETKPSEIVEKVEEFFKKQEGKI